MHNGVSLTFKSKSVKVKTLVVLYRNYEWWNAGGIKFGVWTFRLGYRCMCLALLMSEHIKLHVHREGIKVRTHAHTPIHPLIHKHTYMVTLTPTYATHAWQYPLYNICNNSHFGSWTEFRVILNGTVGHDKYCAPTFGRWSDWEEEFFGGALHFPGCRKYLANLQFVGLDERWSSVKVLTRRTLLWRSIWAKNS